MADPTFYKNYGPFSVKELAMQFECDLFGDKEKFAHDISPLSDASKNDISFLSNKKYLNDYRNSKAGIFVVESKYKSFHNDRCFLVSNNPHFLFAKIVRRFYPESIKQNHFFQPSDQKKIKDKTIKVSHNSFIHRSAIIGSNTQVGCNTVIGPGVIIGDNCNVADNVTIIYSIVKDNCTIFSGSRIGGEGFGFAIKDSKFLKIPQIGRVLVSKNVEIGCNVTIDRGSAGDTIIGENCRIDNLVQIGHNVKLGKNTILAAMVGISGSTSIGENVVIGGKAGFSGHLKIGNNVKDAAGSGVIKDVHDGQSVGGYPAQKLFEWHRLNVRLNKKKNV